MKPWFNWSGSFHRVRGKLWRTHNLFWRYGLCWGVGVLQFNRRHLFFVGRGTEGGQICIAFLRVWGKPS